MVKDIGELPLNILLMLFHIQYGKLEQKDH